MRDPIHGQNPTETKSGIIQLSTNPYAAPALSTAPAPPQGVTAAIPGIM
jgi:hypothetical protein